MKLKTATKRGMSPMTEKYLFMAGKIYVKELKMIRDKRKNAMKIFPSSIL